MKEHLYLSVLVIIFVLTVCGANHNEAENRAKLQVKQSGCYVGLWTKADPVTAFEKFEVMGHGTD